MSPAAAPCPLCGAGSDLAFTATDVNRELSRERFAYNRCRSCGTLFLRDVPRDLSGYYGGDYHGFAADGEPEWRQNPTLREVEQQRLEMLRTLIEPGRLIDVGAGAGAFAAAAAGAGFDVTAIDMDARCCEYLRDRVGVSAICSDDPIAALRDAPPVRVISMWHSLEHMRDPAQMLAVAADRLELGGVLALGVPNPRSLQFRLLGTRWAHLDAPRHLCLMPEDALVARLQTLGLTRVGATTGDAFGVICSVHGWMNALRTRPASGPPSKPVIHAARQLARTLGPLEHRRRRGPALTLLAVKRG